MNPGIAEEGAKVATSVVRSLRDQPLMLALIIMNLIILVLVYLAVTHQRQLETDVTKILIDRLAASRQQLFEMLAKCHTGG